MTPSIAIVTGAASGIGLACAARLAADGFQVEMLDRDAAVLAREHARLATQGWEVRAHVLDLCDEPAVRAFVQSLPALGVLVNNAAMFEERPFMQITSAEFRRIYEVNLIAAATLTQEAARKMPSGASIVNIASRACLGARNHPHYVASKAALVGYTRASALEPAPLGISVNAIAPGLIQTPMLRGLSAGRLAAQRALQPTGTAGRPEDVAHAVSFFASPRTQYITGQVLFVDGGKSIGSSLL